MIRLEPSLEVEGNKMILPVRQNQKNELHNPFR
jgi:hypothetical protein